MPGWSLWLVPAEASPVYTRISSLIASTFSELFPHLAPLATFAPHITLTSNITVTDSMRSAPQQWFDDLPLTLTEKVNVNFESVQSESKFFKKLFIRCGKGEGLLELCKQVRRFAVEGGDEAMAERFVREEYDPHCSLMYSEGSVTQEMLTKVRAALLAKGVVVVVSEEEERRLQNKQQQQQQEEEEDRPTLAEKGEAGEEAEAEGEKEKREIIKGWTGGVIWLVPTDLEIEAWKPVAVRVVA